jgi:hypothetical protein
MRIRIRVAITASALVVVAALFIATPGAIATQNEAVYAGLTNTATQPTTLVNTAEMSQANCNVVAGLNGCGFLGVAGRGSTTGVVGYGGPNGVHGYGNTHGVGGFTTTGTGVYGENTGSIGIGVWGKTGGTGSAVYGQATANGVGVNGVSASGTGVRGVGAPTGIYGSGTATGVEGSAGAGGTGVYGHNSGSTGIGVWGQTGGTGSAVYGHATANGAGVYGESETGTATYGIGGPTGVYGSGTDTGVEGSAAAGGTGVYGHNSGSTGIGVHGQTGGTGSAVFGEATTNGVGVFGKSQSGAALRGDSPGGTALQVNGKAKFSRSGIVTVAAGTASKTVSLGGVTGSSMVIATAQQNGSVSVKAAVPAAGSFTIYLTGNAPGTGLKVAYFVLN